MEKIARSRDVFVLGWALLLGALIFLVPSSPVAAGPMAAGIWWDQQRDHGGSTTHREQLIHSLRRITGLQNLFFADNGALLLGELSAVSEGSSVARQILLCALGSGKILIIEDHSDSPTVNFGQLDEGTNYEDFQSHKKFDIWRIRLDFDDFNEMVASAEVRSSFDPGFTVMHELLHALGYTDTSNQEEIGDCEHLVNQARAELGVPLRDRYFGESVQIVPKVITVRLRFRSQVELRSRTGMSKPGRRWHYLYFLLPSGRDAAQLQKSEIVPNSAP